MLACSLTRASCSAVSAKIPCRRDECRIASCGTRRCQICSLELSCARDRYVVIHQVESNSSSCASRSAARGNSPKVQSSSCCRDDAARLFPASDSKEVTDEDDEDDDDDDEDEDGDDDVAIEAEPDVEGGAGVRDRALAQEESSFRPQSAVVV